MTDLTVDSLEQFMRAAEKEYLQAALALLNGDLQETAKTLGLARSTLFKKVADHEIGRPSRYQASLAGEVVQHA
ncbi:MAG: helix-turn-helix domain-containing protein [Bdellovibrionota bacterium]